MEVAFPLYPQDFLKDSVFVYTSHQQFSGIVYVSTALFCIAYFASTTIYSIGFYIAMGFLFSSMQLSILLMILLPATFELEKTYTNIPKYFNHVGIVSYIFFLIGTFSLFLSILVMSNNNTEIGIGIMNVLISLFFILYKSIGFFNKKNE